jgi:recombination protein RecR
MQVAHRRILTCATCGNIDTIDPCTICQDARRDPGILLIVETVSDLWALERARLLPARYHVLGGVLSPLDGVGPDDINIAKLLDRIREGNVREAILAVNATVDGQTTAHYIADLLAPLGVKTTRLAHGVPVGGELDYLDEGTLAAALERRTAF